MGYTQFSEPFEAVCYDSVASKETSATKKQKHGYLYRVSLIYHDVSPRVFCKAHRFAHESSLVGGAITILKNMRSSMGRIFPIHYAKIIQMFQTTNQVRIDESLKGTSADLANITQKLPAAVSTKNSSEKTTKTKCPRITPIVSKYIMNYPLVN